MNWDDLKICAALHKQGSYAKAAKELGLNETTVSRRLARLEQEIGTQLFETADGKRRVTHTGRHALSVIQRIAVETDSIKRVGTARKALVRRRIACVEAMASHFLAPAVADLVACQPHLQIEFLLSADLADLSRWETDIALRLVRPEKGNAVMRKIAEFEWILVKPAQREPSFVCGYNLQHVDDQERRALLSQLSQRLPVVVSNGMSPMKQMLLGGKGIGVLPDFMCFDLWKLGHLELTRLGMLRPVWLLVQEHLRHDTDTRLVADWLETCLGRNRAMGSAQ